MKKRLLIILAAMSLVSAGLVGCDKSKDSKDTTEAKDSVSSTGFDTYANYANDYVKLGEYKGIKYETTKVEVTDEEVQAQLDSFVSSLATTETITDRAVQKDDIVNIAYVGKIDGEAFEGGSSESYDLTIGSGTFIEGFEDQLIGANTGDTVAVNVTFPADYSTTELAGKEAIFDVTINSISVSVTAELSDELIANNSDYDTVDDYKAYLESSILENKQATTDSTAKSDILTAIMADCEISGFPKKEKTALVDEQIKSVTSQAESYGIDYATYVTYLGYADEAAYEEAIAGYAEDYIKEKMVICAIAMKEDMTATSKEIKAYAEQMVTDYSLESTDEIYDYYDDEDLAYFVVSEKVMDFLVKNAVATEVEATTEATTEATVEEGDTTEAEDATEEVTEVDGETTEEEATEAEDTEKATTEKATTEAE